MTSDDRRCVNSFVIHELFALVRRPIRRGGRNNIFSALGVNEMTLWTIDFGGGEYTVCIVAGRFVFSLFLFDTCSSFFVFVFKFFLFSLRFFFAACQLVSL